MWVELNPTRWQIGERPSFVVVNCKYLIDGPTIPVINIAESQLVVKPVIQLSANEKQQKGEPARQGAVQRACGAVRAATDTYCLPPLLGPFLQWEEHCTGEVGFKTFSACFATILVETLPVLPKNTVYRVKKRFKRMPFGLANAPSYFQSVMDRVLSGIGGVICYIDDVLIATASIEEHLALLKTIFARLAKYNIKLKKEKCLFLQKEIEYLGHLVTGEGIRPLDHKVQAIQKAKTPTFNYMQNQRYFLKIFTSKFEGTYSYILVAKCNIFVHIYF
ncbi:K02A2.6-like [Cordylochernes scorpioides]|uniref:K02A2.6-like n=1 Tax=Cordylochernes scorpioides TaxID=51811 RepID=A0ABY6LLT6_9ARAC|nr:K02A2.6-like [Cordylochernes scorpioides]